jgi:ribosome biogenesis GTP-binding protein ysxC
MAIRKAEFVCSSERLEQCPKDGRAEVAFIGRSNVGKSSLINMLTQVNGLAKVSGMPGKTRLINHFLVNDTWYLVDLPGYGYAQASHKLRAGFERMIRSYILERENLYCLFVLVDARHEPLKQDLEFIQWAGENGVPLAIVFTKCDKLTTRELETNRSLYQQKLLEFWEECPLLFTTSSTSALGREELEAYIESFITTNG